MDRDKAIQRGIAYLRSTQQADGSFCSYSSPRAAPFVPEHTYRTTFVPALILGALHGTRVAGPLRNRLCQWLLAQKSDHWSFNYWAQDAAERNSMPYPDDLDDTFCALIGVWRHNPARINAAALGNIVKLLLATEATVGGPYRTWLVTSDSPKKWQDVDIAVNSNIAYFLRLAAAPLPHLTTLMEQAIAACHFTSPYYPFWHPIVYYVARAYDGPKRQQLANFILSKRNGNHWGTPLRTALALSALQALSKREPSAAIRYLLSTQQADGSWPAEAFCIDPARKGTTYYHGASALTTALAIEALQNSTVINKKSVRRPAAKNRLSAQILSAAAQEVSAFDKTLQTEALTMLATIQKMDKNQEILLLPYLFAESLTAPLTHPHDLYVQLGLANTYGWMAYTIYDDFLDNEGQPRQLSVANAALRYSLSHFRQALPQNTAYQAYVERTFTAIDEANAWEVARCRFAVSKGRIAIGTLPSYGQRQRLAARSLGHTLTPLGVLAAIGAPPNSAPAGAVSTALQQYLIARQLHDDIHDWQQDIVRGHINYVAAQLLRDLKVAAGRHNLRTLLPHMQRMFWHQTVATICHLALQHTKAARTAAQTSGVLTPVNVITTLCDGLDASALHTLTEQRNAKQFLAAYRRR